MKISFTWFVELCGTPICSLGMKLVQVVDASPQNDLETNVVCCYQMMERSLEFCWAK